MRERGCSTGQVNHSRRRLVRSSNLGRPVETLTPFRQRRTRASYRRLPSAHFKRDSPQVLALDTVFRVVRTDTGLLLDVDHVSVGALARDRVGEPALAVLALPLFGARSSDSAVLPHSRRRRGAIRALSRSGALVPPGSLPVTAAPVPSSHTSDKVS